MPALKQKPKCPHLDPWAIKLDQNLVLKLQQALKLRTMAEAEEKMRQQIATDGGQALAAYMISHGGSMPYIIRSVQEDALNCLTPKPRA